VNFGKEVTNILKFPTFTEVF